ncbi:para-aminobenzoate synthase [Schizosaccharomyces japonicus yFS275]|uniref:aminodeoxychorismate synthase n=1 Tax=Schizosaccharomyces japonicus (strain yFS275 / FY16936) TaxID=402676 RepID=B6K2E1_SCHJY|nr:para-aminobenzoate synthase [Schizosaccharomyces japonicus yFS275]EEB07322.1 para-aminobenzoate synthase [Schizosaccharomyces japonicus yFS275]
MRILVVDCYDSYTYNVCDMLQRISKDIHIVLVHWDKIAEKIWSNLHVFDAIVIGPGPGHPNDYSAVLNKFWETNIPTLGICLGFQSLCLYYGATVEKMSTLPWHGRAATVITTGESIYQGVSEVKGMRYHSLYAHNIPVKDLTILATTKEDNLAVAVQAKRAPHYGILYHPESICSTHSQTVINNFLLHVVKPSTADLPTSISSYNVRPTPFVDYSVQPCFKVCTQELSWFDPLSFIEKIERDNSFFCFLDSAKEPGEFSMLGFTTGPNAYTIHYQKSIDETTFTHCVSQQQNKKPYNIWKAVAEFMSERKAVGGLKQLPFHGGLMGVLGYEANEMTKKSASEYSRGLNAFASKTAESYVDAELAFVDRSFVFDLVQKRVYAQTLIKEEQTLENWWDELLLSDSDATSNSLSHKGDQPKTPTVTISDRKSYCKKVQDCQSYLLSGDSYELCLTDHILVQPSKSIHDFDLYKRIRNHNPASYAGFMRLPHITHLSASPERFCKFENGHCHFSPIKGTLKRTPTTNIEVAKETLLNVKDSSELNMIIDLIRNDLYQLATVNSVSVPQLYSVEEHPTVYSLVSHIYGDIKAPTTGWDVLAHSFPPGSMTGAPKLRSIQLLEELESLPRGVYSGIFGYWDASLEKGEFSVIIRSTFRYHNENIWHIGAGGAITVLSTPDGEFDEMLLKVNSVLPAFSKSN